MSISVSEVESSCQVKPPPADSLAAGSSANEGLGWSTCSICEREFRPENDRQDWIQCDACGLWSHLECVKAVGDVAAVRRYHCRQCVPIHGPSDVIPKVHRLRRSETRINYAQLHDGDYLPKQEPLHARRLQNTDAFSRDNFPRLSPARATREWAYTNGWSTPILVPQTDPAELGMQVPRDLTVSRVADIVGGDTPVIVMDVVTQEELKDWDMQRWSQYYAIPARQRERILNVISLEFSDTALAKMIERPRFANEMDLMNLVWPQELFDIELYPKVQNYCLMSVEGAYTDFHVDFGGTSVYYHVLKGSKVFYFIPPTAQNMRAYDAWNNSRDQRQRFLADEVSRCVRVQLHAGDTMFIPSGWIHAVYTAHDSLVIGGNFLTSLHLAQQLRIHHGEALLHMSERFRFPFFDSLMWYTVLHYMPPQKLCMLLGLGESGAPVLRVASSVAEVGQKPFLIHVPLRTAAILTAAEYDGLCALAEYLFPRAQIAAGTEVRTVDGRRLPNPSAAERRRARNALPPGFEMHGVALIRLFGRWLHEHELHSGDGMPWYLLHGQDQL